MLAELLLAPTDPTIKVEVRFVNGLYIHTERFPKAMTTGVQHKHDQSHVTLVMGRFVLWRGDESGIPEDAIPEHIGGENQPCTVEIEAYKYHRFLNIDAGGILACIFVSEPKIVGDAQCH